MPAGISFRPGRPQIFGNHRAEFEHHRRIATSITGSASRRPITSRSLLPRRKLSVPGALRARVLGLVAPCFQQGIKDATKEHADCHDEAKPDWHFTTKDEITDEDLCSDEDEDDSVRRPRIAKMFEV